MNDEPERDPLLPPLPRIERVTTVYVSSAAEDATSEVVYSTKVERKSPDTVFIAYPYSFSKEDYRGSFSEVASDFEVNFVFADEQITNKQILEKITSMIQEATFSIFDITTWNPNVALELGIAIGLDEDYYILFNPEEGEAEVPSDVGGIDRLQYTDYASLRSELRRLLTQQFGGPDEGGEPSQAGSEFATQLERLRDSAPDIVAHNPGIQMGGIASQMQVPIEHAQAIVRPLVGETIVTRGQRRGTRYFIRGDEPPEEGEPPGENGDAETQAE